jgi:ABC-type phosphate transport system substrate-binding protein
MRKSFILACIAFLASLMVANARAQVIVIANPSVKASQVGKDDLRDVFTGAATSFKDGSKVAPILLKDGPANEAFLKQYVGKGDAAFRAGWRSLVFSGQASMPKTMDDDATAAAYVAHNAGAVGYIDKGTAHEGTKVIEVH